METPPKSPNGSSIDPGGHRSGGAGGVECSSIATPTRARSRFVKSNLIYVGPWDRGTRGSLPLLADADAAEAAVAMVEVEELEPPAAAPTAEAPASASPTTQAPGGGDVPTDDAAAADAPSAVDVVAVPEREELSWKVVCIMYGVGAAICAVFF